VSPVIATILLVAVVVVLAATIGGAILGVANQPTEPPRAVVSVEETTFTESAETNPDYKGGCAVDYEVGFRVSIDVLDTADRIYVVVRSETGERLKTVWDDPEAAGVGSTRFLANEQEGNAGVDVDIGKDGSDDWALCPNESGTLAFYGEYRGETWLLTEFDF